jgi:large subunit ribosomal protein L29
MKFEEIKELTSTELRKRVLQLREELFEARMKASLGQLGNPIEIRDKRKDLARLKTALQMKLGQRKAQ